MRGDAPADPIACLQQQVVGKPWLSSKAAAYRPLKPVPMMAMRAVGMGSAGCDLGRNTVPIYPGHTGQFAQARAFV